MNRSTIRSAALPAALFVAAFAASACDAHDQRVEITETRKLAEPRENTKTVAGPRQRFMPPTMGSGGSPHGDMSGQGQDLGQAPTSLAFDLPAGWKQVPPTPLRALNFLVPGHDGLECYVTVLPGGGGGVTENLNRWRKQMALAPMTDAEVAGLARLKVLGVDAPYLEMDGTFSGAGGAAPKPGYTMAAAAMERAGTAFFVKMVGPSAEVRGQLANYRAFCASLRASAPAASADSDGEGFDPSQLKWTAPEGWTQGPPKQMRVVTFNPKDRPDVECYASVFAGSVGGLAANVDRWRQQLSLPPLSAEAVKALPTLSVLGHEARMVEIDAGEQSMYALYCNLGASTLTVKMTGPTAALRAEHDRFVEFCKSLK
jgi:hypothetical protein